MNEATTVFYMVKESAGVPGFCSVPENYFTHLKDAQRLLDNLQAHYPVGRYEIVERQRDLLKDRDGSGMGQGRSRQ